MFGFWRILTWAMSYGLAWLVCFLQVTQKLGCASHRVVPYLAFVSSSKETQLLKLPCGFCARAREFLCSAFRLFRIVDVFFREILFECYATVCRHCTEFDAVGTTYEVGETQDTLNMGC
jgi:hypothetical protein